MTYRFDTRTPEQFKRDMRKYHIIELDIILRIGQFIYEEEGTWPEITPHGADFTGKFIEGKVPYSADYVLDGSPYEITHSSTICQKYFHQKQHKVNQCIKYGHNLVFVNGMNKETEPLFTIIDSKKLKTLTQAAQEKHGIVGMPNKSGLALRKKAIRYDIEMITDWNRLPKITKGAQEEYKHLLNKINANA